MKKNKKSKTRRKGKDVLTGGDEKASTSSCSDNDISNQQQNNKRRSSRRLMNQKKALEAPTSDMKAKGSRVSKTRGDYDADAESSPEKDQRDPYDIDMIEYVPPVSRKQSTPVDKPSSHNRKRKVRTPDLIITPEVTPILHVSADSASPSSDLADHHMKMRARKRKSCSSPDTPTLPTPIFPDVSQGDSGIVMSPTPKRSVLAHSKTGIQLVSKMKKRAATVHLKRKRNENNGVISSQDPKSSKQRKPLATNTSSNNTQDSAISSPSPSKPLDDSCFGFSSISSPLLSSSNLSTQPISSGKKHSPPSYRTNSGIIMSDSSGDSPSTELNSLDSDMSLKEQYGPRISSPLLFSDSFDTDPALDADSIDVNRSSSKMYKISQSKSKMKKSRKEKDPKPSTTSSRKLDGWVSKFNMEIEDIEKFDLLIE